MATYKHPYGLSVCYEDKMKFKLQPGMSIPKTLIVNDFTTTISEVIIKTVPEIHIPVINNIIGMPMLTLREHPETVTYTNHWRTIEINTLEELLKIQNYLGDIIISQNPCSETHTEYSIDVVPEYDD